MLRLHKKIVQTNIFRGTYFDLRQEESDTDLASCQKSIFSIENYSKIDINKTCFFCTC